MKFFSNITLALLVLITRIGASNCNNVGGGGVATTECPNCGTPITRCGSGSKAGAGTGAGAGAVSTGNDSSSSDNNGKCKKDSKSGGGKDKDDKGKSSAKKNGVDFQDTMTMLTLVSSFIMTLQ